MLVGVGFDSAFVASVRKQVDNAGRFSLKWWGSSHESGIELHTAILADACMVMESSVGDGVARSTRAFSTASNFSKEAREIRVQEAMAVRAGDKEVESKIADEENKLGGDVQKAEEMLKVAVESMKTSAIPLSGEKEWNVTFDTTRSNRLWNSDTWAKLVAVEKTMLAHEKSLTEVRSVISAGVNGFEEKWDRKN